MIKLLEKKYRSYFPKQLKNKKKYSDSLKGLSGIEIGGPSKIFTSKGLLPVYDYVHKLDGCNYSSNTLWEGSIKEGMNYNYDAKKNRTGFQYIAEGSDLSMIGDGKYDFLLSCHNLEHLANPIKALYEWKRIIKEDGYVLIVLPHKDLTFDRKRTVTSLAHLIEDYNTLKEENDTTHFKEILEQHDFSLDEGISEKDELAKRLGDNINNRCAHHHVFNTILVAELLNEIKIQIVNLDVMWHNIFILAQKKDRNRIDNRQFLSPSNSLYSNHSKYPSDIIKS